MIYELKLLNLILIQSSKNLLSMMVAIKTVFVITIKVIYIVDNCHNLKKESMKEHFQ